MGPAGEQLDLPARSGPAGQVGAPAPTAVVGSTTCGRSQGQQNTLGMVVASREGIGNLFFQPCMLQSRRCEVGGCLGLAKTTRGF